MVQRLCDLMGTRYIINILAGNLRDVIEACVANGTTLDLAGCRFGPASVNIIHGSYGLVDFINTEEPELNSLLLNNCEAARQQLEEYELLDLQRIDGIDTYLQYAVSLQKGAKVKPDLKLSDIHAKATLVLLIMTRPDVEFDILHCGTDIYEFVRDMWVSSAAPHESYYELIAPNITIRQRMPDGVFGCDEYGYMEERSFIRSRMVIPTDFGNSQIISVSSEQTPAEEWIPVIEKATNIINVVGKQAVRVKGRTVKDFLTFRRE